MVSKSAVFYLLDVMLCLSYILERARDVSNPPFRVAKVRGQNMVLDSLKRALSTTEQLAKFHPQILVTREMMQSWIEYLEQQYKENTLLDLGNNLKQSDGENLSKEAELWIKEITNTYAGTDTVFINEREFYDFPKRVNFLDKLAMDDLLDGIQCISNDLPTPAVMISCRVAEKALQEYYKKVSGIDGSGLTFGQMVSNLKKTGKSTESLMVYLQYLNDERINADHPYKRYTKKESEEILFHVIKAVELMRN